MLTGPIQIQSNDWGVISSAQNQPLGASAETTDGRVFKYGLAGAADLAIGKLAQQAAVVANHQNIAVAAAAAAGATQVTVTLGATAATANQYAGGYLNVIDSAGAGATYLISGHPAASASGSLVVNLSEPITTALTTSSKVNLTTNPYSKLVISAVTTISYIAGVPGIAVTAAYYGWFQVRGVASVLSDGAITAGKGLKPSDLVTGAVEAEVDTDTTVRIGTAYNNNTVDTKYSAAYLRIV
mgnify:CR=1 FL=1